MKKVLILVLTLSLLLSCVPMVAFATEPTPTTIATAEEFKTKIAADPAGSYILTADIDFGGEDFASGYVIEAFTGTLDGDGHAVYGYDLTCTSDMGLFMSLSGTVKNIQLGTQAAPVTVSLTVAATFGPLAAYHGGNVVLTNIDTYVNVNGSYGKAVVGGLMGVIGNATVTNCTTNGTINMNSARWTWVGGLVAQIKGGTASFNGCANLININNTSGETLLGGIAAGYKNSGSATFTSCANFGTLTGACDSTCYVGGILGTTNQASGNTTITNCYNFGNVSSELQAGGILGYNVAEKITNITGCTNKGAITGAESKFGNFYGENADTGSALTMDNANVPAAHTATIGVQDSGTHADLRFIASVDALTYTNAGVVGVATWTEGTETKTWSFKYDCNTVYNSILSHEDNQTVIETAESGKYLMALILKNVPADAVISLTSYVEDANGTTYGDTVKVTHATTGNSAVVTVNAAASN